MSDPIFLTLNDANRLHARSLAEHGGSEGVRDAGLVESALASAKNTYFYAHGDVFDIAASYAFHLAEAQAFIDGNKRTAVAAALVFLAINGVYARPSTWHVYQAMIQIAEKKMSKTDLAAIFRRTAGQN
jgi:death-on-curing protein